MQIINHAQNIPDGIFWIANYNDNTFLQQYQPTKDTYIENKYTNINRKKLISFEIWNKKENIFSIITRINLEPNQRLIFRRRVRINIQSNSSEVMYLVGWQQTIENHNIQSILCIMDNGFIELIGRWKDNDSFYCSPILIDDEK